MRRGPSRRLVGGALLTLALALAAAGCSRTRVEGTEPSLEALARAVLDAVERRDLERLRGLALSEEEFRDVVWPELPAARPERNLTADYVWNDLRVKSAGTLARTLDQYAETPLTLVGVRFDGDTSQHRSYLVRRKTVLVVQTPDGARHEIRLFGSVFEQNGRYKVFSYNVD